jgi:hypothetical protein
MRSLQMTLAALAAVVPLYVFAQDAQLTPEEVKAKWVGRTAIGSTASGVPVELRLSPDGTASIVAGTTTDSGTWRTFEKGFCTTWKKIRADQERCFTGVTKGTVTTLFNPDGTTAGQYTEFK